jgi:hypothetical protein
MPAVRARRLSEGRARWVVPALLASVIGWSAGAAGAAPAEAHAKAAHPVVVFTVPGDTTAQTRLRGSWIDLSSTIGLTREASIRSATYIVDEPKGSTVAYAIDRTAPFVLPRKGKGGKHPYAVGEHTLRADVELRNRRHVRLDVAYTVARTLHVPASVDAASFVRVVSSMPPGQLLVRPEEGADSYVVTGDVDLRRGLVSIEHANISGGIVFEPASSGSRLLSSTAVGFDIYGADNITIAGNVFDGHGVVPNNQIWDKPAGSTPDNFVISRNTFRNFYRDDGSHSEALYIGYSTNGLVQGNVFENNGNTAHIFFTYFGSLADPASSFPRNMCVRGNVFGATHSAFLDVDVRPEIPRTANIVVQPNARSSRPELDGTC